MKLLNLVKEESQVNVVNFCFNLLIVEGNLMKPVLSCRKTLLVWRRPGLFFKNVARSNWQRIVVN